MKDFFFLVVFITGLVFLLHYLRKREVEKFMESDIEGFQTLNQKRQLLKKPDPIIAQDEAYTALTPCLIGRKQDSSGPDAEAVRDSLIFDDALAPTLHRLKIYSFDEVIGNMLVLLEKIAPKGVLMLLNVSLSEFVKTETGEASDLATIKVTDLLCNATTLDVICGAQHRDTGAAGRRSIDHVKSIFVDIGLPLLEFPVSNDISEHEVRDTLAPVLLDSEIHACPGCAGPMTIRRAIRGKSAGKNFQGV